MDKSIIGLIVFIVSFILSRIINERAIKDLNEKEKAKLIDGFSKYRIFSLIGVIVLVGLHYGLTVLMPNTYVSSFVVFVGVLVFYLLLSSLFAYSKLKQLGMPDGYVNQFLLGTLVQYIGIFVFFGFLLNKHV